MLEHQSRRHSNLPLNLLCSVLFFLFQSQRMGNTSARKAKERKEVNALSSKIYCPRDCPMWAGDHNFSEQTPTLPSLLPLGEGSQSLHHDFWWRSTPAVSPTFIQVANDSLLLQEIIAKFLVQAKSEHVVGESTARREKDHSQEALVGLAHDLSSLSPCPGLLLAALPF